MQSTIKTIFIFIALVTLTGCHKYNDLTGPILGTYQSTTGQVFIGGVTPSTFSISYNHDQYFINKATMSDASNFTFDEIDTLNSDPIHYIGGGQFQNNSLQLNMSVTDLRVSAFSVTIVNFNGVKIP
jgi:hypothetical protein